MTSKIDYKNSSKLNDVEFLKYFEVRAKETIRKFKMFSKKDKIIVAASGGKDSTALLYLMNKFGYKIEAMTVNAHIGCYSDDSLNRLRKFCSEQKIKLHKISLRDELGCSLCYIISSLANKGIKKTSCSVCGSIRRYLLNKHARKHKASIILTGHNLDDEANAMMLALFSGNLQHVARIGPITSRKKEFICRAKPLYFLFEDEVERYCKIHKFNVSYEWCPCSVAGSRRFYHELNIEKEKKFNLVSNMMMNIEKLRKYFSTGEKMKSCSVCSEPSSNERCQVCNILLTLKENSIIK